MLSIVIQAGGKSERMGENKALIRFRGETLIERLLRRVSFLADELLVTTNQPEDLRFLNVRLAVDRLPGKGALGGLYTALYEARMPYVIVLACDMPFVNPELLKAELEYAQVNDLDVLIPRTEEGLEPLHAVYRRENCLDVVLRSIQTGNFRMISWLAEVKAGEFGPEKIRPFDPDYFSFFNINTPADRLEAEKIAERIEKPDI